MLLCTRPTPYKTNIDYYRGKVKSVYEKEPMFKDFVRNIPLSESSLYDNTNLSRIKRRFNNMLQDKWGREKTPDPLHPSKVNRHAKSREPGKLVTGHFWRKIRTFFRNHSIKEINLRVCFGFVKKWFK